MPALLVIRRDYGLVASFFISSVFIASAGAGDVAGGAVVVAGGGAGVGAGAAVGALVAGGGAGSCLPQAASATTIIEASNSDLFIV